MKKIAIIGVGNILLGDEGIGVHVVRELENARLPKNVEVYDCGVSGMKILNILEGFDKAIIIDAVKAGGKPGEIYRFALEEALTGDIRMTSLHELDLITAIKIAKLTNAYKLPKEVVVIGVEPKSLEESLELSPEVKKAIPEVIKLVFKEISGGYDHEA